MGYHSSSGRQPRRDRPAGVRHLPPARDSAPSPSTPIPTPGRRMSPRPTPGSGCRGPTTTSTPRRSSQRPARPAPTRCTPATDSSRRTPNSRPRCIDAGLTWIGPPVDAVRAMGSKIESKKMMAAAGVPVLDELDPDTVTEAQLPVLVKASAGGGGRGMRVVRRIAGSAPVKSPQPGARRSPRSATRRCSASATCPPATTSRSR